MWCRINEDTKKKVQQDAGMGDGWTRIQVRKNDICRITSTRIK